MLFRAPIEGAAFPPALPPFFLLPGPLVFLSACTNAAISFSLCCRARVAFSFWHSDPHSFGNRRSTFSRDQQGWALAQHQP